MPRGPGERKKVIHDFVARVHEVTKARGVPLSLDLFGVVATGVPDDLEKLGQDITMLAPVCEAISPMLYPSHYSDGYLGYEHPGDHPEVIGVGTKASVVKLPKGSKTVIRSWLQAFPWRAPTKARGSKPPGKIGTSFPRRGLHFSAPGQKLPTDAKAGILLN